MERFRVYFTRFSIVINVVFVSSLCVYVAIWLSAHGVLPILLHSSYELTSLVAVVVNITMILVFVSLAISITMAILNLVKYRKISSWVCTMLCDVISIGILFALLQIKVQV